MAKGIVGRIRDKAVELLQQHPEGLTYGQLRRMLQEALPWAKKATIGTQITRLHRTRPNQVRKKGLGLYVHAKYYAEPSESLAEETKQPGQTGRKGRKEEPFYWLFAEFLVREVEDCNRAIALGGNLFGKKWATPDVIGVWMPEESDIYQPPLEVVSAEIKADTGSLVTAFGQACAYKLFSHKSYIAIPQDSAPEDIARLDALCIIFGIGLVLFDATNPADPKFRIQVRPRPHLPDPYYVNECLHKVWKTLKSSRAISRD